MSANRTKIEIKAINVISEIVDKSKMLLPDLKYGDKGISTDGHIQLFKNEDVDKAENLIQQILVQVKGRTDFRKKLTRLKSSKIEENVDVKDLQNYYRQGGAIFFFVYFDKDLEEHAVFYSVLLPVKCKRYLEIASQNKNKTKLQISFSKMEETGDKIYELCAQFYKEQTLQGFGGGQIMQHIVSWKDLNGRTTLTTNAVGVIDTVDLLKRVVRGDIHFYIDKGLFKLPMEWVESAKISKMISYNHPVTIGDVEYFDHVDVEFDVETREQILRLGRTIIIDIGANKLTFLKDEKSFSELAKASRFLMALSKYKFFSAGEISLKLSGLDIQTISEEIMAYIEISDILSEIGLAAETIINREKDNELRERLYLLCEIANHKKDDKFYDDYTYFSWSIKQKKYPLIVERNEHGKNIFYSLLNTKGFQLYGQSMNGEYYPVPNFSFPSYDEMKKLYAYDIGCLEDQIEKTPINETTKYYLNMGALKLLCTFDTTGDTRLLSVADKALEKIPPLEDGFDYVDISRLQVKKRISKITNEEIELLKEISKCGEISLEFAAFVILDNKEMSMKKYDRLGADEKKELEETPLMTLYHKLLSE